MVGGKATDESGVWDTDDEPTLDLEEDSVRVLVGDGPGKGGGPGGRRRPVVPRLSQN